MAGDLGARRRLSRPEPGQAGAPDLGSKTYILGCFRTRRASCTWATFQAMLGEVVAHYRRRMGYAVLRPMSRLLRPARREHQHIKEGRHGR